MNDVILHYGVKGMKWGVRRTPEQLGHTTKKISGASNKTKGITTKTTTSTKTKLNSYSDEELQRRINRLNLEERYNDLVKRQNSRNESSFKTAVKRQAGKALENLAEQTLSRAVTKLVNKMFEEPKFNIDKYKNVNVNDMDAETLNKVSEWYKEALGLETTRQKLNELTSPKSNAKSSSNGAESKVTNDRVTSSGSVKPPESVSAFIESNDIGSKKLPWLYSKSGYDKKKIEEQESKKVRDIMKKLAM